MACRCGTLSQKGRSLVLKGNVLVTGGAGYLGRAILKYAAEAKWPCRFTVFSRDEEKQWRLQQRFPDVRCILGDVRDYDRLEAAFCGQDIVIHAGAIKFVPEAEFNVAEAISVNLLGSSNVARAAVRSQVSQVISISTDKACLPVNVYGMTKALMERLMIEADTWGRTKFTVVRYGNVIGSTGSVIPLFLHQKATSGRITVTDPLMTRFWLTAKEAVDIVLKATEEEQGGTILVPRCGAMKLQTLAELIAQDSPIDVIGPRPGEKPHEELVHFRESVLSEEIDGYYRLRPRGSNTGAQEPFTYASHTPAHWVTKEAMWAAIEEAATI